ncbi:unnamed protein product [Candida verbasci]|uniref:Uncharacterized protein n=1 Tax=Candida verbasci TaxID=1227364 RepID=A0A9W4XHF6_9ASCO|nr:unnamed protein product [Candida verbasci]
MGLLTIIKKQKIKDKEIRILTLGLDNSGKTTIIKKLLNEDTNIISPTMGFQINSVSYKDYTFNMWDIGGQTSLRTFWGNYFDKTDLVIWVIDGLNIERLNESFKELQDKIIQQDRLNGIYLAVLINKIDLIPEGESIDLKKKVNDLLQLEKQIPLDKFQIELVSGKSGQGITQVLDWIITRDF